MSGPVASGERLPFSQAIELTALEKRLSIGIVFGVFLVVFFLIAWNRGVALLYGLWAVMVVTLLISLLGPWLMLRPVRLKLTLPASATVGTMVDVDVEACEVAWPGHRVLIRLEGLLPFAARDGLLMPSLRQGQHYRSRLACSRRGVFTVNEAMAFSAYPLGLLSRRTRWDVERAVIEVSPRVWPVYRLPFQAGRLSRGDDEGRLSRQPGSDVFRDTRDYRPGDSPRHIHWRSSARHDRLIVRQFDCLATTEVIIVLDTQASAQSGDSLEKAIELAASLLRELSRQGVRCGLAAGLHADGRLDCWLPPASGDMQWRRAQRALTRLQAGDVQPYDATLQALRPHFRAGQSWVLFDHGARTLTPPAYLVAAAETLLFRFDRTSFHSGLNAAPPQPPRRLKNGWLIAANSDLAQVFR